MSVYFIKSKMEMRNTTLLLITLGSIILTLIYGCHPENRVYIEHKDLSPGLEWLKSDSKEFQLIIEDNKIDDMNLIWKYSFSREKLSKDVEKPKVPYSLKDMAEDCINILSELSIKKAHILGTSMGGMIAQLVAFNYPDRCKSLISVMSTSGNPKLPRPSKEVIEGLTRQPKSSSKEDVIENNLMTRRLWASPKYPTSEEILREKFSYRYDRMYYPDGSTRQYAAIGDDGDRTLRLKKISSPTLVLHGSSDNLVPLEAGKDTHRNISGSNIEILDGWGHDLPEGTHDWIVDKIHNHIKSCDE